MKQFNSTDFAAMEKQFRTTFMNSVSGFKSLQMVGTVGESGISNLAIFNSIFHVGAYPPYIGMVVRPDGNNHETLKNILASKMYTLNNVIGNSFIAAHQTSARYLVGQSEFGACGFTEEYVEGFSAPFVKESTIKMGLEFKECLPFSLNNTTIVIGEVKYILMEDDLIAADGFVDLNKANSVTAAGLDAYYTSNPLGRLTYAKPEKQAQFLNVNISKEK
jgi:flavin reductase (DIM6/NTAB) family NADH-FMN oxidoreductase RutF